MSQTGVEYSKGLAGVIAGESSIATVGLKDSAGEEIGLLYRGYTIQDMAENCCFDEVSWSACLARHGSGQSALSSSRP